MICAHKCLLAARCEVFRAMFAVHKEEDVQPTPLVLTDIRPKTFLAVLEFIYGNCCSVTTECVVDIMAASIEYGLDGLTQVYIIIAFNVKWLYCSVFCSFVPGI